MRHGTCGMLSLRDIFVPWAPIRTKPRCFSVVKGACEAKIGGTAKTNP